MRISDWSSDVCSSDLTAAGWEVLQFRDAVLGGDGVWTLSKLLRGQGGTEKQAAAAAAANARFVLLNAAVIQPALPLDLRGQIGRASCRGSVCQYVLISVVAVALKKKKQKTTKE